MMEYYLYKTLRVSENWVSKTLSIAQATQVNDKSDSA